MMTSIACLLLTTILVTVSAVDWDVTTQLDEYVNRDDGYYQWTEMGSYDYDGSTLYILNMTSQRYMTDAYVTRSVWWHIMGVAIPDEIKYPDFGFFWICGGFNTDYRDGEMPPQDDTWNAGVAIMANETGYPVGYVFYVPNQPVVFANDPEQLHRFEDDIIAWSWRSYLDDPNVPSNADVILRMPMTKAAKKGLDAMNELVRIKVPGNDILRFGVAGVSKRGWTVWSLAATDRRVVIAAPFVFSLINMEQTLQHHFQALDGHWSFALNPYWSCNLTQEIFNPKSVELAAVEDMWSFRERFTIPFLAISSSGDEFFTLDENRFWWDSFPSQHKYLQMLPNAEHIMVPHWDQSYETIVSFVYIFLEALPWPSVSWTLAENAAAGSGSIVFVTNPIPDNVTVWAAVTDENDTRRDFRLITGDGAHLVPWRQDLQLVDLGGGTYRVDADTVAGEWRGFFFEGTWQGPTGKRMIFTSQINVIPYTYPWTNGPCTDAESCYGSLI